MIREEKSFCRRYSYGITIFLVTASVTLFFLLQAKAPLPPSITIGALGNGAKKSESFTFLKEPALRISDEHKAYLEKIIESCAPHEEFLIAQSGDFSGHFKLYGNLIQQGIRAYFDRINREEGGIAGKQIHFIAVEDYGDPQIAAYNVRRLKEACGIELFMGNMGTRLITSVLPDADAGKIALLFPWGGSDELRNPQHTMVINGLGYMQSQLEALVTYVKQVLKKEKTVLFYADSEFSTQLVSQIEPLLAQAQLPAIGTASYNRFTFDVLRCSEKLVEYDPKVVFCLATSMPTVKLIRHFFRKGLYGTEFVGIDSTAFVKDILQGTLAHYAFSSAVPDARLDDRPLTVEFRQEYARLAPDQEPTELAYAYYLSAAIFVTACKKALAHKPNDTQHKLSKEAIIKEIEQMKQEDIGGFEVTFNPQIRHAFGTEAYIIVR